MKIVKASIYLVRIGRLHPVLVELVTDAGIAGIGEAGVAYGLGAKVAPFLWAECAV